MRYNIGFDKTYSSDGCVYAEHGLNKVAVMINGPQESSRRVDMQNIDKVLCRMKSYKCTQLPGFSLCLGMITQYISL